MFDGQRVTTSRCLGRALRYAAGAGLLALALVSALGIPGARAGAASPVARPHRFAAPTPGDTNQLVQVAAMNTTGRADGAAVNGVDMKLKHEPAILNPAADASYSYSIGAYTAPRGYWLQMGSIVLGSDSPGLARWFVQVLSADGAMITWTTSRAGAANPPPACSACSGGSTDGYPFGFTSDNRGTWTFWFDGLRRTQVSLPDSAIDPARGSFFIGEVTAPNVTPNLNSMSQRTALRTLSLWSNQTRTWAEAKSATATYYTSISGAGPNATGAGVCPPNGIVPNGVYSPAGNYNGIAHETLAGSGVACSFTGAPLLWTY